MIVRGLLVHVCIEPEQLLQHARSVLVVYPIVVVVADRTIDDFRGNTDAVKFNHARYRRRQKQTNQIAIKAKN